MPTFYITNYIPNLKPVKFLTGSNFSAASEGQNRGHVQRDPSEERRKCSAADAHSSPEFLQSYALLVQSRPCVFKSAATVCQAIKCDDASRKKNNKKKQMLWFCLMFFFSSLSSQRRPNDQVYQVGQWRSVGLAVLL